MSNNKILRLHSVTNWCYKLQSLFTKCLRVFSLKVFSWFSDWIQTRTTAILKLCQISLASTVIFCRGFKKVHYSFVCERRRHDYESHFPVTHFVFRKLNKPITSCTFYYMTFQVFCILFSVGCHHTNFPKINYPIISRTFDHMTISKDCYLFSWYPLRIVISRCG